MPILQGTFGKPSPRRLRDGTRALAIEYTGGSKIVARTAASAEVPWSEANVRRSRQAV